MIETSRFLLEINMKEVNARGVCYTYSKDNLIPRVFHLPTPTGAREEKGQSLLSLEPLHSLSKPP